jgi:hypothetical protein
MDGLLMRTMILTLALAASAFGQAAPQILFNGPVGFNGFNHYIPIVISSTLVSGTQTSYVLTIDHMDANLKTVANGGFVTNANCFDCGFYSDICVTKLSWDQLQVYDGTSAGRIVASVQVGTVANGSNETINLCVGNSSLTSFQGGATGTAWPAVYRDVKHFSKNGSLDLTDYTSNGNNGTVSGNMASSTSCPFGQCASGSTGGSAKTSASGGFASPAGTTIQMWVNFTSVACCGTPFNSGSSSAQWYINAGKFQWAENDTGTMVQSTSTYTTNTWFLVTTSWNGSGTQALICTNGVADGSSVSGNGNWGVWTSLYYMQDFTGANNMPGKVAEARVRNEFITTCARPLTDYNNQNAPDTFAPWGTWR